VEAEKKIRALVVEDNPTQANMLRISLTRRGFDVEAVAYLAQGLERLEKGNVDVILLDLTLPDSDGIQTFYEVYNRAPDVPIVVLSGMNDQAVAQAALEGGAQDYLVKGVPSDESISRCLRYAIERHRFERKLWESERITRLIVENAHDAFLSMDAQGVITGWNLKAETVFGWYRKDTIGKPLLELIFPADVRSFFQQQISAFLQGQRGNLVNNRVETFLLRADGKPFPAELAMFPITIGSSYTLCAFVQDISDRRLVEHRLHQINLELEKLVHERTTQLDETHRQLQLFSRQAARHLQEPLVNLQSQVLTLARMTQDGDAAKMEEQIDSILECANQMASSVQALALHGRERRPELVVTPVLGGGHSDHGDLSQAQIASASALVLAAAASAGAQGASFPADAVRSAASAVAAAGGAPLASMPGSAPMQPAPPLQSQASMPSSPAPASTAPPPVVHATPPAGLPAPVSSAVPGANSQSQSKPPISQIRLPDQMVPTSNISSAQYYNNGNNGTGTAKSIPHIEKVVSKSNPTKTLPAMPGPGAPPGKE
jgi:PAS domain S-box-containing protein